MIFENFGRIKLEALAKATSVKVSGPPWTISWFLSSKNCSKSFKNSGRNKDSGRNKEGVPKFHFRAGIMNYAPTADNQSPSGRGFDLSSPKMIFDAPPFYVAGTLKEQAT